MRKLLESDKKNRRVIKKFERKKFIFQTISNNSNLPDLLRFNAFNQLNKISIKAAKPIVSNRCVLTVNKKKFSKLTHFSRTVFFKLARNKHIYGLVKASW